MRTARRRCIRDLNRGWRHAERTLGSKITEGSCREVGLRKWAWECGLEYGT